MKGFVLSIDANNGIRLLRLAKHVSIHEERGYVQQQNTAKAGTKRTAPKSTAIRDNRGDTPAQPRLRFKDYQVHDTTTASTSRKLAPQHLLEWQHSLDARQKANKVQLYACDTIAVILVNARGKSSALVNKISMKADRRREG